MPGPTSVAGRSTVTCRPGWLIGAWRASRSISSQSESSPPSGTARSGASSSSGSGLSGSAP